MPIRLLRPGLTTSKRFNRVSWFAQALYVRLITLADDYGRLEADPELLRSLCFPFGDSDSNPLSIDSICQQMTALCGQNLIIAYEIDGKKYAQITKWKERVRTESKLPPPPKNEKCQQMPVTCQSSASICGLMTASPPSPSPSPSPSPTPLLGVGRVQQPRQQMPADAGHLPAEVESSQKRIEGVRSAAQVLSSVNVGALYPVIEAARKSLSAAYGRPLLNHWPYDEEHALANLASRGEFANELASILDHRANLPPR